MIDWLFHLAFVVLFLGFFGIRGYYFRRAKRVRGAVSYIEGWGHRALRLLVGVPFMLALGGYMLWPGLLAWAAFPLPAWARGLGLALGLASVALMVWVQRALGANFDVTLHLRAEHSLVTDGPYRWVRHPMYSVLFLFELAVLLLTANWFVGGVPLATLTLIIATRVWREEALMLSTFGATYQSYKERTGRFLPRWSLR
ncbi:MAG TPA: isoprenylcysteine carboxylmethyltransferase family protein [Chloroflexaceae bacterium]|nr:isoprenylcysteine carboxylmethyltransferase family protein [Chloroflexaceae bacterium]